jgi:hypothetical protein
MKKQIIAGLTGVVLGIMAYSVDVKTSESFKFNNPIPINASESQIRKIVNARPEMKDTKYSLDILGMNIPLVTYRAITDPTTGDSYSGRLDSDGNIHSLNGLYALQFAHDSNWYEKQNWYTKK